jgi:hypothetical protein
LKSAVKWLLALFAACGPEEALLSPGIVSSNSDA